MVATEQLSVCEEVR